MLLNSLSSSMEMDKSWGFEMSYPIGLNPTQGFYFPLWIFEHKLPHKKRHKKLVSALFLRG